MVVIAALTVLSTVGIGFYLRFLVALLLDYGRHRTCYLVRLQPSSVEYPIPDEPKVRIKTSRSRVA